VGGPGRGTRIPEAGRPRRHGRRGQRPELHAAGGGVVSRPQAISEYPFAGKFLDVGGAQYHYLDEGAGEPVLMLHGNPTWSFHYRRLALALRDRYRVLVPDHIGCGLSDKPPPSQYSYTLDRRARDVEALLDHLGIDDDLTLVLHDWGGMIGMLVAHRRPERIKRLVLFNTAAF